MPDPFLPPSKTTPDSGNSAADIMSGRASGRIASRDEWLRCRQPEILAMLQEYQYGYYPDHSLETVKATRSGITVNIEASAGSKTGKFKATLALPAGASEARKVPVVINIGGMQNQPYLQAGIAVVGFDYTSVAADSNSKTGAFWDLYKGKDIGALAAGLFDTRIALTMPMSSGVQGLGPYRYHAMSGQDETLENSKAGAGWWSDSALGTFVNHSEILPYDAHTVAAAIAPRALVVDRGSADPYTNSSPTAVVVYPAAKAVYGWLGAGDRIAMAVRRGGHCDMSGYTNVLPFVQKILQGKNTTRDYNDLSPWSAMPTTYPWATNIPKT
ncbi:hypothetical protein LQW54_006570 [Pestalotiopsis sp. IQ-011]